jgi:hypothetical protein
LSLFLGLALIATPNNGKWCKFHVDPNIDLSNVFNFKLRGDGGIYSRSILTQLSHPTSSN